MCLFKIIVLTLNYITSNNNKELLVFPYENRVISVAVLRRSNYEDL